MMFRWSHSCTSDVRLCFRSFECNFSKVWFFGLDWFSKFYISYAINILSAINVTKIKLQIELSHNTMYIIK